MFIPDPGVRTLIFFHPGCRILDLTRTKKRKENILSYLFVAINITEIVNFFIFDKIGVPNSKKCEPVDKLSCYKPITPKLLLSSRQYGFGIQNPRSSGQKSTYPGFRIKNQGVIKHRFQDPRSGSATLQSVGKSRARPCYVYVISAQKNCEK